MKKTKKLLIIALTILIMTTLNFIGTNFIGNNQVFASSNVTNTVDDIKSNNYLQSLEVTGYEISPEFNKNTTNYYLVIPADVSSVEVLAVPESENAKAKVTGNTALNRNESTIKIVVTSENGKNKTYNITVTKQSDNGLSLTSLEIENGVLTPELTSLKYDYTAEVNIKRVDTSEIDNTANEDIDKIDLNITAVPNIETAQVEILGDKDIKPGENLVTIILKNGEIITTYQITVNATLEKDVVKKADNDKITEFILNAKESITEFYKNQNNVIISLIVLAVILLLIIILVIVKIVKRKNAKKKKQHVAKRAKH